MNLQEYFDKHSNVFRAILEPIPNNETDVRVTPYVGDSCGCGVFSLDIPRDVIADLSATSETYRGKKVVEISFHKGASIDLTKVFDAMLSAKAATAPKPEQSYPMPQPQIMSQPGGQPPDESPIRPLYTRCCCLWQSGRGYDTLQWSGSDWYVAVIGRCDGSTRCNYGSHGRHFCY